MFLQQKSLLELRYDHVVVGSVCEDMPAGEERVVAEEGGRGKDVVDAGVKSAGFIGGRAARLLPAVHKAQGFNLWDFYIKVAMNKQKIIAATEGSLLVAAMEAVVATTATTSAVKTTAAVTAAALTAAAAAATTTTTTTIAGVETTTATKTTMFR